MAVNIKKSQIYDISCSGKLIDCTETELIFEDKKTGIECLTFDLIKELIGSEISLKITKKNDIKD